MATVNPRAPSFPQNPPKAVSPLKQICGKLGKGLLTIIRKIWECIKAIFCGCCKKKQVQEIQVSRLKKIENRLVTLAEKLKGKIDPKQIHYFKGQQNLGNTCYFNASIQALETVYVRNDEACLSLLDQDLSLGKEENLAALEKRLLHKWAPVSEAPRQKMDTSFDHQVLFKWSFLLLMQAKKFGDPALRQRALTLHHSLCFALERGDFKTGMYKQKDAAIYLELWHDILGFKIKGLRDREAEVENYIISMKTDENENFCQIEMPHEGVTFKSAIKDAFVKRVDDNKDVKFPLHGKDVIPSSYTEKFKFKETLPEALFFQMKRFLTDEKGKGYKVENDLPLGFEPNNPLDLNAYIASERQIEGKYRLTSLISHTGNCDGGHYVAYVRNGPEQWVLLNDSSSTPVKLDKIPFEKAYILGFNKILPEHSNKAPADNPGK